MKYTVYYTLPTTIIIEANSVEDMFDKMEDIVPLNADIYGYISEEDECFHAWDGSEW